MTPDAARPRPVRDLGLGGIGAVAVAGAALAWLSHDYPAELPVWAPYDFSWVAFLGIALPALWYARGLIATPAADRPGWARTAAFATGTLLIYGALLTRFVYLSQHMFFLNRLQHLGMHHVGPFLVALAWPGPVIARGAPAWAGRLTRLGLVRVPMRVMRQPAIAGLVFVGLVALWLEPAVHFRAMVSPWLYDVMNWSMVVDGLLFWFLVLDPRPAAEAGCSFATRLAVTILVVFPQLVIGSHLTFTTQVLYSYYDLCGRLFPSVSAITDQHIGGIVVWVPAGMMSAAAFLLIMNNMRLHEDRAGDSRHGDIAVGGSLVSSASWTGR